MRSFPIAPVVPTSNINGFLKVTSEWLTLVLLVTTRDQQETSTTGSASAQHTLMNRLSCAFLIWTGNTSSVYFHVGQQKQCAVQQIDANERKMWLSPSPRQPNDEQVGNQWNSDFEKLSCLLVSFPCSRLRVDRWRPKPTQQCHTISARCW